METKETTNSITRAAAVIVGAAVLLFAGYVYGSYSADEKNKQVAIDNGYAEYQIVDKYSGKTELVWRQF